MLESIVDRVFQCFNSYNKHLSEQMVTSVTFSVKTKKENLHFKRNVSLKFIYA